MSTLFDFLPYAAEFPSASFAQLTTLNASMRHPVLAFDAASPEYAIWSFIGPSPLTAPLKVKIQGAMSTAVTGSIMLQVYLQAVTGSNLSTACYFDSANSTCAIGVPSSSAGVAFSGSIQLINTASLTSGDNARLMISRNATSASDDAAGDFLLTGVELLDSG